MMFWDSSAVLPLLVKEADTDRRRARLREDPRMIVWWACRLECASALSRLRRDGSLDEGSFVRALGALDTLADGWYEVQPTSELQARAMRILRVHPLRADDAAQLAAALIATAEHPPLFPFLTADDWLREAAQKEGFAVD